MKLLFVQRAASQPFQHLKNDSTKKDDDFEQLRTQLKEKEELKVEDVELSSKSSNNKEETPHAFRQDNIMKSKLDTLNKEDNNLSENSKNKNSYESYDKLSNYSSSTYQIWA